MNSSTIPDTRSARLRGLVLAAGVYFAIGYHVVELCRSVRGALRSLEDEDEQRSLPVVDEDALRRELREVGGLGPDTIDTILDAARAPATPQP